MQMLKMDPAAELAAGMRRDVRAGLGAQAQSLAEFLNTPRTYRAGDGCMRRMVGDQAERDLQKQLHAMGMHITDRP